MICDHPECTGKHGNGFPTSELCPAALERRRKRDRERYTNMTPEERERYLERKRESNRHYREAHRDEIRERRARPLSQEEATQFWEKVEGRENRFTCWEWTGALDRGYGNFKNKFAHRIAWELTNGPIPQGMVLDHLCRWRRCVNPLHLDLVTQEENVRRGQVFRLQEVSRRPVYVAVDEKLWGFFWQDLRMYASLSEIRGLGRED